MPAKNNKETDKETKSSLNEKTKKQKRKLTPEEASRLMWMQARNSYRHRVERSRPSWITSDDMIDGVNYYDPDENFNPFRGY